MKCNSNDELHGSSLSWRASIKSSLDAALRSASYFWTIWSQFSGKFCHRIHWKIWIDCMLCCIGELLQCILKLALSQPQKWSSVHPISTGELTGEHPYLKLALSQLQKWSSVHPNTDRFSIGCTLHPHFTVCISSSLSASTLAGDYIPMHQMHPVQDVMCISILYHWI